MLAQYAPGGTASRPDSFICFGTLSQSLSPSILPPALTASSHIFSGFPLFVFLYFLWHSTTFSFFFINHFHFDLLSIPFTSHVSFFHRHCPLFFRSIFPIP
jgi:hypothetical protein